MIHYNYLNSHKNAVQSTRVNTENRPDAPLLDRRQSDVSLPGLRRRSSVYQKKQGVAALSVIPDGVGQARPWFKHSLSVFAVCVLGSVGFNIAFIAGFWKPTIENPDSVTYCSVPAQILGYVYIIYLRT